MSTLDLDSLDRFDSLFVASRGADVPLSCPARVHTEVERGRRVLVVALFEPAGVPGNVSEAIRHLGASYTGGGLPAAQDRRSQYAPSSAPTERGPEDEDILITAAKLLAEVGARRRGRPHPCATGARGLGGSCPRLRSRGTGVCDRRRAKPVPLRRASRGLCPWRRPDAARAARRPAATGGGELGAPGTAPECPLAGERAWPASRRRRGSGASAHHTGDRSPPVAHRSGLEPVACVRSAAAAHRPCGRRGGAHPRPGGGRDVASAGPEGPCPLRPPFQRSRRPGREEARRPVPRREVLAPSSPRATACQRFATRSRAPRRLASRGSPGAPPSAPGPATRGCSGRSSPCPAGTPRAP